MNKSKKKISYKDKIRNKDLNEYLEIE